MNRLNFLKTIGILTVAGAVAPKLLMEPVGIVKIKHIVPLPIYFDPKLTPFGSLKIDYRKLNFINAEIIKNAQTNRGFA